MHAIAPLRRAVVVIGMTGALAAATAPTTVAAAAGHSMHSAHDRAQSTTAPHGRHHHKSKKRHLIKARRVAPYLATYRNYVASLIKQLSSEVTQLQAVVATGDFAQAQSLWLTAHLTWLRIGEDDGAYGAFGALGRRIDGTAAGLQGGTSSDAFTGFHKVELDLWTTHNMLDADNDASQLSQDVQDLSNVNLDHVFAPTPDNVTNWITRAHEVIEDAVRDSLSGDDDYGSGTDAASVTADAEASTEIVTLLKPLLASRSPHLVHRATGELKALTAAADATRENGKWVALDAMPRAQRERLDAVTGAADETLAPVPDLLPIYFPPNSGPPDVT